MTRLSLGRITIQIRRAARGSRLIETMRLGSKRNKLGPSHHSFDTVAPRRVTTSSRSLCTSASTSVSEGAYRRRRAVVISKGIAMCENLQDITSQQVFQL